MLTEPAHQHQPDDAAPPSRDHGRRILSLITTARHAPHGQPDGAPTDPVDATTAPAVLTALSADPTDAIAWTENLSPSQREDILSTVLTSDGRLTPSRLARAPIAVDANAERALARAQAVDELRSKAFADNTMRSYGSAVCAWRRWCRDSERPVLPFDPAAVVDHLLDLAFEWTRDGQLARDDEGVPQPALMIGAVAMRLAALNKAAEFLGLPKPGQNAGVREVMRGIRRTLGAGGEHKKAAIDLDALERCLAAAAGGSRALLTARALILARARARASAGQLASLTWPDVELGAEEVVLDLAPRGRHTPRQRVAVPRHPNPELCLLSTLSELRRLSPALGAVFTRGARTMSRTTCYETVNAAAHERGGWSALPALGDRALSRIIPQAAPRTAVAAARDRALLATGFYTAARRSHLEGLNWDDLIDHGEDGFSMLVRRSKTDQEGRGFTVWIPQGAGGSLTCPATLLRAWRRELTTALGRAPAGTEPVFPSLTPGGRVSLTTKGRLRRLPGGSINDVVQKLVVDAGLAERPKIGKRLAYGAHSLRVGFVTEALRDDKLSVSEVADVTQHRNLNVLYGYRREVNAAKRNPARKLLAALGDKPPSRHQER